jgi:hypothetical protein
MCPACQGTGVRSGSCPVCSRAAASYPVVGAVVPAAGRKPQEVPTVTPDMARALQQAQARDKAYADAKAVATRLRRQLLQPGVSLDPDEVMVLVDYFLPPR